MNTNKIMDTQYDVIVIGAGLSGLTAALALQKAGLKVLVLEKNSQPGGLCGTFSLNNYEFVIGCNDFCTKVSKLLKELNVPVQFKPSKTRFYFENTFFDFPPNFNTFLKLVKHGLSVVKLYFDLKKINPENETVESFANKYIKDKSLSELFKSLSYPYGMPPSELYLSQLKDDFSPEFNYDYQHPLIPLKGPKNIIDNLVEQFTQHGGEIKLNVTSKSINQLMECSEVMTSDGMFTAKYVISSKGRYKEYPSQFKPGFSVSKIQVAVDANLKFPTGYHTIVCFPSDISQSLTDIDKGKMPTELGFHFFPHYPSNSKDYYSINIYCYLPRGLNQLNEKQKNLIQDLIFTKIENIIPGFNKAILNSNFISVDDFKELHGVASVVTPIIAPNFQKPNNYDEGTHIYYVGNTVYPPGNHAGAAMLSGMLVADEIKIIENKS